MNEITKELLDALKDAEEALSHVENNLHVRVNPPTLGKMRKAIIKAEAALDDLQPFADGWIPWKGGDCPVGSEVVTQVKGKGGDVDTDKAHFYDWWHTGGPCDIIAYRVVKP